MASRNVGCFLGLFCRSFCLFPSLKSRISYFPAVLASPMMAITIRALGVEETSASWLRQLVSIQSLGLGPTAVEIKSPSSWSKLKRTFSLDYDIYINVFSIFCVKNWIFLSYACVVIKKLLFSLTLGTLRSNDATATRMSLKKWICVLPVFIAFIRSYPLTLSIVGEPS